MKTIKILNKKASFEYEFIQKYIAGIVLKGTEVKSLRKGKASIKEAYCYFNRKELFIKGMHIAEHNVGEPHGTERDRKLLLTKKELKFIKEKIAIKGLTIIPISVFFNEKQYVKLEIAIAKGKKEYDKRESLKIKTLEREAKIQTFKK